MKIVHATWSDSRGGAARAAHRVHHALVEAGADSWMVVDHSTQDEERILAPTSPTDRLAGRVASRANHELMRLQRTPNQTVHSPALVSGGAMRRVERASPDVVNLHWVGRGLLTIRQIARLEYPVVWRLADMWTYCGAEHLDGLDGEARWRHGYSRENRPEGHSGLDIDRWTWNRKRRGWTRPFHVVAPSRWTAERVAESALLGGWPTTVIPNPLPLDVFRPFPPALAREELGLPPDKKLVLFGAAGGTNDPNKGFDLLDAAMHRVTRSVPSAEVLVFGASADRGPSTGYPTHWMGQIEDDDRLAMTYSAADVVVVPSRREAFGQTGTEAHACGTPVVAFLDTGLEDVVEHRRSGYLAEHLDVDGLAEGIVWVLSHGAPGALADHARRRAEQRWSPAGVAEQYLDAYDEAVERQRRDLDRLERGS